jgi:hypothetical protein
MLIVGAGKERPGCSKTQILGQASYFLKQNPSEANFVILLRKSLTNL